MIFKDMVLHIKDVDGHFWHLWPSVSSMRSPLLRSLQRACACAGSSLSICSWHHLLNTEYGSIFSFHDTLLRRWAINTGGKTIVLFGTQNKIWLMKYENKISLTCFISIGNPPIERKKLAKVEEKKF